VEECRSSKPDPARSHGFGGGTAGEIVDRGTRLEEGGLAGKASPGIPAMTLAVDCRELVPGRVTGIGRFLLGLLEEIAVNRPQLATVALCDPHSAIPLRVPHLTVHRLPRQPGLYVDQILLPRVMRQIRATAFFSPYYKAPLAAPCATTVTIHDLIPISFPEYTAGWGRGYALAFRAWAALLAGRATAVITDSEYSKAEVTHRLRIPSARVRVIPIGVGAEFRPDHSPEEVTSVLTRYGVENPYLLAVGNFLPHKNLARLVEAYTALPAAETARVRLVLAGTPRGHGPARPVGRDALARPGVILPGFVAPEDLPLLYAGATALVCPSLVEGFGLPVLEAMACGTPVVCARAAALPEVAADAALYVDPMEVSDIAAALRRILEDADLRLALRARGLARARAFDPRTTTARLVDLLESLASGPGGR
jgi:glycosyltransferase involved in cell wall biosynthesis